MISSRSAGVVIVLLLLALLLGVSRCGDIGPGSTVGAVRGTPGPAQPAPAGATVAPVATTGPPAAAATSGGSATTSPAAVREQDRGTITVDGRPLLPLRSARGVRGGQDLSGLSGHTAVGRDVPVLSVPADEGFWIGTGGDRVWVQLTGVPPESPYVVRAGDTVTFRARIVPNGPGFAGDVGVTRKEGSARLTAQRQHLEVAKRALGLHP